MHLTKDCEFTMAKCIQEDAVFSAQKGLMSTGFSVSELSLPTCDVSPRSLLIKVEVSNLESAIDKKLIEKMIKGALDVESDKYLKVPVGSCVKGFVIAVGESVESFQGLA